LDCRGSDLRKHVADGDGTNLAYISGLRQRPARPLVLTEEHSVHWQRTHAGGSATRVQLRNQRFE
jgi:hypothetical protein